MVSSILKVGTQLDIKVLQQVAQAETNGEKPRAFRSMIYDIRDNGDLEIGMPLEGGRLVLLPLGVRYELVFSTKGGMYRSIGLVKERYKSGNLYMVVMELKESLSKCQRREYYRMECLLNIEYMSLTFEEMQMSSEEILEYRKKARLILEEELKESSETEIASEEVENRIEKMLLEFMNPAVAVDVSGGGMRFIAEEELEIPSDILIRLPIRNSDTEENIYLRGTVLSGKVLENSARRHEYRVKFALENGRVREEIIKFIFEEERKGRNIKKG